MKPILYILSVWTLVFGVTIVCAQEMIYIYHSPESKDDVRYNYHWEVLKAALEKTKQEYGPYIMKPSVRMSEKRQVEELKTGEKLTILIKAASQEHEKMFIPVRIPLDKGLIGYRVFLIRKDDQPAFSAIKSLEELKKFSVGQGLGWSDAKVWRANGFKVVEGSDYEGLFAMTVNGRFGFFSRGIVEIIGEYEQRKNKMPDLHIEETIAVYYPWPFYFYFPKSEQGRKLATRVEKGLLELFEDKKTFDPLFFKYHGEALKRHNLKNRKVFRIKNPLLTPETPLNDQRLWYDPYQD
jgi:hypothetical protein